MVSSGWLGRVRLTVGRKLALIAGALAVGLVVVVIVGASGMGSMDAVHNDVVNVGEAKALAAQDARGAAADLHFSQTLYVLDGGAKRSDYLTDRHTFQVALDRLIGRSTDATDKPFVAAIQSAVAGFDHGDVALWALVSAHRSAAATKLAEGTQNAAADTLMAAFTADQKTAAADVATQTASFKSTASSSRLTMILVGIAAILLGSLIAFVITRQITRGVRQMLTAADGIAGGDVDQRIEVRTRDELGATAEAFRRMIDYLKSMVGAATRIADSDLTVEIEPRSEHDALGNAFEQMTRSLRHTVSEVSSAASQLSAASQEMSSTSEEAGRASDEIAKAVGDVAQGAERQVRMVEQARYAAEEVARAVGESAQSARSTAQVAQDTRQVAQEGVGAAQQATDAMRSVRDSSEAVTGAIDELAAKSEKIGAIVQTITGIAQQTNLLALNAAIEAARAGEQGRGFAVVAEEVRKLAEESQHAAHEIADLIAAIQNETTKAVTVVKDGAQRTQQGAAVVEQTREAFQKIDSSVEDMTARIEQIAAVSQQITASATSMQESIAEIATVAEQSSASTEEVSAATEQTSASTQQIAASAQELATNAEQLNDLVAQFKTAG
jgi:methyl-accepting chemotaxis protein